MIYSFIHDKCFALNRTKYSAAFAVLADRFAKQLISVLQKHLIVAEIAQLVELH